MQTHVKIVGWLWIIYGLLGLFTVMPGIVITNIYTPNASDAVLVTVGSLCFFLPGIIAAFIAGYGLLEFRNWGRILAIILAVFNLVLLCFLILPAALGIYTLIIMFNDETKSLFNGGAAPAEMEPAA